MVSNRQRTRKQLQAIHAKQQRQIRFVKQLATPKNKQSYDFWHGITDKYPQCCIDYYINVHNRSKNLEQKHIGNPDIDKIQTGKRIMCPLCITKEVVK